MHPRALCLLPAQVLVPRLRIVVLMLASCGSRSNHSSRQDKLCAAWELGTLQTCAMRAHAKVTAACCGSPSKRKLRRHCLTSSMVQCTAWSQQESVRVPSAGWLKQVRAGTRPPQDWPAKAGPHEPRPSTLTANHSSHHVRYLMCKSHAVSLQLPPPTSSKPNKEQTSEATKLLCLLSSSRICF